LFSAHLGVSVGHISRIRELLLLHHFQSVA
jgi:hypothetical protein